MDAFPGSGDVVKLKGACSSLDRLHCLFAPSAVGGPSSVGTTFYHAVAVARWSLRFFLPTMGFFLGGLLANFILWITIP